MSSSTEKMNHARPDDVKSTKDMKEMLKNEAKMFVSEEHVTRWVAPKSKRNNQ